MAAKSAVLTILGIMVFGCDRRAPEDAIVLLDIVDEPIRHQPTPAFRLGVADAPSTHALHIPRSPVFFGNDIAVTHAQREIRVFTRGGEYVRTIGREGSGPGEFNSLRAFTVLPGMRFMTLDNSYRRLQILDSTGTWLSGHQLGASIELNTPPAFFNDGTMAATARAYPARAADTPPRIIRDTVSLFVFDAASGAPEVVGRVLGHAWWRAAQGYAGVPLGPRTAIAGGRGFIAVTEGVEYKVSIYTLHSRAPTTMRVRRETPAVSSAVIRAWQEERQQAYPEMSLRALTPRGFDFGAIAKLPAYWRLIVDDHDCIWAQRYRVPGTGTIAWDVIDPWRPALIAVFHVPGDFSGATVSQGIMLGIDADDDGVERIVGYNTRVPPCVRAGA